jgi:hypothetical protein
LLFGLLGAAIVEINAPQLHYFARGIDKTGYLHQAMPPYRAMEFVRGPGRTGHLVLSVDSCPLLYTPDPRAFRCVWPSTLDRDHLEAIMGRRGYRLQILPVAHSGKAPAGWRTAYSDESFQVYARGQTR